MPYTFKTLTLCSVILPILAITLVIIGCSAENPICSTNFCAVGEVFPRSELEDGQAFSEVDIDDSVIFATLVGTTPVETTPAETPVTDSISFDDIVTDAAAGGTKYVGQTVTITAAVRFKFETAVSLFTNNENVNFYVRSPDMPNKLNDFEEGRTYQIKVEVTHINPPDEQFDTYAVFSNIDALQVPITVDPVKTSLKEIVEDVTSGDRNFLGNTVSIRGEVRFNFANPLLGGSPLGSITLVTNNTHVSFFISDPDKNTGVANMRRFQEGQSYNFTVFIYRIAPSTSNPDVTNIYSQFIESN